MAGLANAVKPGAPLVWPDKPGNVLFDVPIGDKKATEAAFAKAHAVAEISVVNPRVVTNFMETRAAVASVEVDLTVRGAERGQVVLAAGAELKNTFTLVRDGLAFVSAHVDSVDLAARRITVDWQPDY